ncbi:septum formation initiator family protein [Microbacterium sp. Bi128]|uniref:FtsB family cell division protein n=1 Tax=Microbacterium sp. Bi128 TaxID=2821115 RepID=UPI001DC03D07|nr:septum formation initiator family protein [Microbacterium sp. Bi128]CAH0197021.1 Cell division protein FtsL [Microbacterium sp. Bi128]
MERPTLPSSRGRNEAPASGAAKVRRPRNRSASAPATAPATGGSRPPRARRVDVREWLGGLRISGFVVIMLGLVVLGTFVLVPTVGTYMDQRQQIQALQSAVALSQSEVADLQSQRERWSDPAYITTQARERLYYTLPGEVVYLIDDDLPASEAPQEQQDVSADVGQTRTDWMSQLVRSVTSAGAAQVVAPAIGVPDPAPDASPAP